VEELERRAAFESERLSCEVLSSSIGALSSGCGDAAVVVVEVETSMGSVDSVGKIGLVTSCSVAKAVTSLVVVVVVIVVVTAVVVEATLVAFTIGVAVTDVVVVVVVVVFGVGLGAGGAAFALVLVVEAVVGFWVLAAGFAADTGLLVSSILLFLILAVVDISSFLSFALAASVITVAFALLLISFSRSKC
jgi:hypothetical protein